MIGSMRRPRTEHASRWLSRRAFLRRGLQGSGALALALGGPGVVATARAAAGGADSFGPLQPPDGNGLMLPPGLSSRVIATSGAIVAGTAHVWHQAPDGGATFATADGGWIYVSNAEVGGTGGGVGAVRFGAGGEILGAYSILSGTARNCAGGPTPWGTWLSCEEWNGGRVFECDPYVPGSQGVVRPALGSFAHEAAAVDPLHEHVYMTEDMPDGLLYRFTPGAYPDLGAGLLEAAQVLDPLAQGPIQPGQVRPLAWHVVPNPSPPGGGVQSPSYLPLEGRATRYQVPLATPFNGGEGMWFESGLVHFATKGQSRVWTLDTAAQTLEILYDYATSSDPELLHVDNLYASPIGDVYVAEDPGNLQIVALTAGGDVKPVVQLTGVSGTEITGPALSPDGRRLYWSSQRNPGRTYEVTGPFAPVGEVPLLGAAGRALLATAICLSAALALRGRGDSNRATLPRRGASAGA
jgi:secreted PhoX family phosphatase